MNTLMKKTLAVVFLAVFLWSGWQLYRTFLDYAAADAQYEALEQYVSAPATALPEATQDPAEENDSAANPDFPQCPQVDFQELRSINSDVVGWLVIEDTRINYPIVQGEDDEFYLKHRFDGQRSSAGCLFLDAENDAAFQDANQIVYGHYMKDGSMFHDLGKYKEQAFFDAHPTGWLITPETPYHLQFFSGYVSDVSGDAWEMAFTEADHAQWLAACTARSCFSSGIVPAADSPVLTLSTCSYEFENARFVLHAVLQPPSAGE